MDISLNSFPLPDISEHFNIFFFFQKAEVTSILVNNDQCDILRHLMKSTGNGVHVSCGMEIFCSFQNVCLSMHSLVSALKADGSICIGLLCINPEWVKYYVQ